jgi:hypothetical protein
MPKSKLALDRLLGLDDQDRSNHARIPLAAATHEAVCRPGRPGPKTASRTTVSLTTRPPIRRSSGMEARNQPRLLDLPCTIRTWNRSAARTTVESRAGSMMTPLLRACRGWFIPHQPVAVHLPVGRALGRARGQRPVRLVLGRSHRRAGHRRRCRQRRPPDLARRGLLHPPTAPRGRPGRGMRHLRTRLRLLLLTRAWSGRPVDGAVGLVAVSGVRAARRAGSVVDSIRRRIAS